MITCITIGCDNPVENPDTGLCASCGAELRKAERRKVRQPVPINKISDKQKHLLSQYAPLREKFLHGRWCGVHGANCIPTEVHHMKGKAGYADEKEIPLLVDTRYWLAVCREAHTQITNNSAWAEEKGYTVKRTQTTPH